LDRHAGTFHLHRRTLARPASFGNPVACSRWSGFIECSVSGVPGRAEMVGNLVASLHRCAARTRLRMGSRSLETPAATTKKRRVGARGARADDRIGIGTRQSAGREKAGGHRESGQEPLFSTHESRNQDAFEWLDRIEQVARRNARSVRSPGYGPYDSLFRPNAAEGNQ